MSESPQPVPAEVVKNASDKLASLHASAEYVATQTQEEAVPAPTVTSESAPALPQRKPAAEASAAPNLRLVTNENVTEVAPSTSETEQATHTEPEVPGIYTSTAQHTEVVSPANPSGAADALNTLRASGEPGLAEPVASLENETPDYVGKRIDTTVKVDDPSRATETVIEQAEGKHVSEVELTPDSEIQTGGKHLADEESEGKHVSETEITPDSEIQTGGAHIDTTTTAETQEIPAVTAPLVEQNVQVPEKSRKFGAILRRFLKR